MDTSQVAEQALAKLDAEDAGESTENKNVDEESGSKASGTDSKELSGDGAGAEAGNKDDDKSKEDKTDDKEEAGTYTADDGIEVDETPPAEQALTDNAGIQLSPQESKYIADNIGEPLVLRGIRGEGDNAKEVEFKAYSVNDIPADFHFTSDQQRMAAQTGFVRLESKAEQLLGSYRNNQSQTAAQDFDRRENEGIRADVADLQRDKRFPLFKVQPGAPGFDETPEAKQMAEVLQVMSERNQTYLKQYQQGRPYKHIGFAEAYDLWEANNPDKQAAKAADKAQAKEDVERKGSSEKIGANRGMAPAGMQKATVKAGTTVHDIINRLDMEEW